MLLKWSNTLDIQENLLKRIFQNHLFFSCYFRRQKNLMKLTPSLEEKDEEGIKI